MSVDELEDVRSRLAEVDERLGSAGAAAARRHAAEIAALEARFEEQGEALARARATATGLRSLTSPDAMLARAPAVLCAGTRFQRALLSTVSASTMVPTAVHLGAGPEREAALLAELGAEPLRLEHRLPETEVLRRRRATLVASVDAGARVSARLGSLMGWDSYVAAPVLAGATVAGILHAGRDAGEPLDEADREVLWEFASTLSQAYESASLRRALRREREELRRFLEWANARSLALAEGPVSFSATAGGRIPHNTGVEFAPQHPARDDRLVFSGVLTRRELDVLRLLATGGTNRTIADSLVLSETTVKFHVNSILRKLHVANRAEAVARYLVNVRE